MIASFAALSGRRFCSMRLVSSSSYRPRSATLAAAASAVPRFFAAQRGFTIALFGGVYTWLACARINRAWLQSAASETRILALTALYAFAGTCQQHGRECDAGPGARSVFLWWARRPTNGG